MEEIKSRVYNLICEQFSVSQNDITDETGPGDLAKWDSIGQLRLILGIEKEFDLQLSIDHVISINNVRDIIEVIKKHIQKEEKPSEEQKEKVAVSSVFHPVRVPSITYCGSGSISVLNSFDFSRVALITGSSSYAMSIIETVRDLLSSNIDFKEFHRPDGEPKEVDIIKLAGKLQDFSPNLIIAIGGGSTIDTAKLSWLLYEKPDFQLASVDDSIHELQLRSKSSFIAAPTTFSGAEVSSAAVFTKVNETGKTVFVLHDFIPDKVILDPNLGKGASLSIIYSSAFDALTHAIEGYVSIVNHPLLESNAIMAVKNIINALNKFKNDGVTANILEMLFYSGYYAGILQNHCSVGLTHSFAHQLGGFSISHGTANAMFLVPVVEYNSARTKKYTNLLNEIGFESINEFLDQITKVIEESSIFPNEDVVKSIVTAKPVIIKGAMNDITFRTNPVSLNKSEVEAVFDNAIEKLTR